MRVTPGELRTLRQGGMVVRFALLDSMAFVLAELPSTGSAGTALEQPCTKPHWAFVIAGEVMFETEGHRQAIGAGSAFHIRAGGPPHILRAPGAARLAGFEPVDKVLDTSDAALAAQGFEVLDPEPVAGATVIPPTIDLLLDPRRIEATAWAMSSYVLTQTRFGPGSGYTANWCDAPHWGLVTAGRLAIEWENDVEIAVAGDVYHCPGGPPGHRVEAADPANTVDLTPIEAFAADLRVSLWRRQALDTAKPSAVGASLAVAALR